MKQKTFYILLATLFVLFGLALFLTGKRPANKSPADLAQGLQSPFRASALIRMQELTLKAGINQGEDKSFTVEVTEPASLNGMTFSYDGRDIRVGYRGISVRLDENTRLLSSLASVLISAINKASAPGGAEIKLENGAVSLTGNCESGAFEMVLDRQNGSILTLRLPGLDFDCQFNEFAFL